MSVEKVGFEDIKKVKREDEIEEFLKGIEKADYSYYDTPIKPGDENNYREKN